MHIRTGPDRDPDAETGGRLRVFSGICCDFEVGGGLNPAAVEVALRTGAKVVWMPTSSIPDRRKAQLPGPGHRALDERAKPTSPLHEILPGARARCRRRHRPSTCRSCSLADTCRELGVRPVMTHALETHVGADHTLAQ
jgi:hypothetical protein